MEDGCVRIEVGQEYDEPVTPCLGALKRSEDLVIQRDGKTDRRIIRWPGGAIIRVQPDLVEVEAVIRARLLEYVLLTAARVTRCRVPVAVAGAVTGVAASRTGITGIIVVSVSLRRWAVSVVGR
jgi:hypothetical protein